MRTIRMTIAYDGTDFAGFQIQPGERTIQETLENAIAAVTGERSRVEGAGRTDSGVHARGQVVSFRTASVLDPSTLGRAVDATLPDDVAVLDVRDALPGFHARFSARGRAYRYTIWNDRERPLFDRKYVYHWRAWLDDTAMDAAARLLVGQHDFAAFCGTLRGRDRPTDTRRRLLRLHCWRDGKQVVIDAAADSFLPHMVRNLVGTLIQVGTRKIEISDVPAILAGRSRQDAGVTAPACGLCLTRVWYD
jgi:tRNA pseudouridine38-40 synthase